MAVYDPRLYDDMRKKDINDLTEQLEMYIRQENFTHPGFYALLRKLLVPFELLTAITKMAEKLKIPNCDPSWYAMHNRKIKERLYPLMVTYHSGIAREGDAIMSGQEQRERTRVISGKSWKDNIRGSSDDRDSEEEV